MADQQLLAGENRVPNGSIVAASTINVSASPPPHYDDIDKLKYNSNGDINGGVNSINRKIGNCNNNIGTGAGTGNTKIIYEFSTNPNEGGGGEVGTTTQSFEPPDGGARAWCVMISGFFCNSIIFGIINTCGTINVPLKKYLIEMNVEDAASKAGKLDTIELTRVPRTKAWRRHVKDCCSDRECAEIVRSNVYKSTNRVNVSHGCLKSCRNITLTIFRFYVHLFVVHTRWMKMRLNRLPLHDCEHT